MNWNVLKYWLSYILAFILFFPLLGYAQEKTIPRARAQRENIDIIDSDSVVSTDVKIVVDSDTLGNQYAERHLSVPDSVMLSSEKVKLPKRWLPDSNRAVWLATLFPGAGQIYNRKYWKLPIFYGGFVACTYALTWNSRMYKDYSQAYLDIMDSDPRTNSFLDFLPPNYDMSSDYVLNQLKTTFKNKKDYYRKYRDLSIFVFIGVYVLSVIDAYVDAELSSFDISKDLSMGLSPAVLNDEHSHKNAYGLQYKLTF